MKLLLHKNIFSMSFIGLLILATGCSKSISPKEQFSITITDEISPKGMLPESLELTSNGKLVMLTNRFNNDSTIYQQRFFLELTKNQLDTVLQLIRSLDNKSLAEMQVNSQDTVIYKIDIGWLKNNQHQNYLLIGNKFAPAIHELINYSQTLPKYNRQIKLKESHYYKTSAFCIGDTP